MKFDALDRAWIGLMALSAGSAVVAEIAELGVDRRLMGVLVVVLALFKGRIILSHYLGLSRAPSWQPGFNLALLIFCLLILGLYLLPVVMV